MDRRKPKKDPSENPFSFKNFITGTATNNGSSNGHNHLNQPSNNRTPVSTPVVTQRTSTERVNNPYSYSRFLQNPTDHPRPVQCVRSDQHIMIQGELPDFVQGHVTSSAGIDVTEPPTSNSATHINGLPDFTITSRNVMDGPVAMNGSSFDTGILSSSSSEESLIGAQGFSRLSASASSNLPDFLNNTGIGLVAKDNENDVGISGIQQRLTNSHDIPLLNGSNSLLSDTNDELVMSARIAELESELIHKNHRIRQLEQQLVEQKQKEESDAEKMEEMMQGVQENLERAVEKLSNAESEIELLTAKVRHLENQLERASSTNPQSSMHLVKHIGNQLGSDLAVADELMRRMMEQSDRLKIIAGHLQFIDRVEDISQADQNSSQPQR